MKKIIILSIIFISFVVILPTQVSAATSAGVKPNSFFYFFDTASEKVNLFFTFNPENKARKALEYADERLAEAETITDSKDSNMVKAVMENYTTNIALASEKSKEVKDQQASENLLSTIADNTSKNQEVLNNVLVKVPEEAKDAILKAIEASKKEQEEATKQIAELKGEVEKLKQEVAELKQEKTEKSNNDEKLKLEAEKAKVDVLPVIPLQKSSLELSNSEIITKVKPAVVYIKTDTKAGTGMIFTPDGYILTNAHVITDSSMVSISTLNNGLYTGRVIGVNTKLDLAIIKIDASTTLPTVVFGDSDKVMQGDAIFTLGFPFGISGDVAFKEGTISRRLNDDIEISAEIHPGNSGGPLVDQYGGVVGINSSYIGKNVDGVQVGETIKFAIPINIAKANIDSLKSGFSDIDPKAEAKKKIAALLLSILSILSQQLDSSCGDAVFQYKAANYFSAKRKIDDCINSMNLKKEKFDKLIAEDLILLNSSTVFQSILSPDDFSYINGRSSSSIGWEILEWQYLQIGINNWVSLKGTELWRLDFDIEAFKLSSEYGKKADVLAEEAISKSTQVIASWK